MLDRGAAARCERMGIPDFICFRRSGPDEAMYAVVSEVVIVSNLLRSKLVTRSRLPTVALWIFCV